MVSTKLRVKELLREMHWTTKVLAEKTGMSESYLTHIKNGTRRWNEDALKKLAAAFEMSPTELFEQRGDSSASSSAIPIPNASDVAELSKQIDLKIKVVPIVNEIPTQPNEYNNRLMQVASGNKDKFIPVAGFDDNTMFALELPDNLMSPKFLRGDMLIVSPGTWTHSGDIVAVEYGDDDKKIKEIAQINYMDDFIVLESVNHRKAPVALVRGKDTFRIIGKVVLRFQKME